MTFQVALAASNGWIMASDTKERRYPGLLSRGTAESVSTSKIFHDQTTSVTYMVAGDQIAQDAAADIVQAAHDGRESDWTWLEKEVPKITTRRWRKAKANNLPASPRTIILAFPYSPPFWEVRVDKESKAKPIYEKVFNGDVPNSAKFFIEEYYDKKRTVTDLLLLAAHTILMGGSRNPTGVGGLQMVFYEVESPAPIEWKPDAPDLNPLRESSKALDIQIRRMLMG